MPNLLNIESMQASPNKYGIYDCLIDYVIFNKLKSINNCVIFYANNRTKTIYLPYLERVNNSWGAIAFSNLPLLEEFIAPNLNSIFVDGAHSLLSNCPNIRKIVLGEIFNKIEIWGITKNTFNDIIANNHNNLIHVEIGANGVDTYKPLQWETYIPNNAIVRNKSNLVEDTSICSNNLEQFLYNFREYVIKRLSIQSSKTYIYLHVTTKSYILGEDDSHYAQTWIVPGESDTYLNTLNDELTARNWGLA